MRANIAFLLALLSWGCSNPPDAPPADICAQAMGVFTKCGVTLPLLTTGSCTGTARAVARCVAHHATNCEELASLTQRIDACVADELDGGEILPPAEDLPLPALADAGHDAAREAAAAEAGAPEAGPDAPPPSVDAGLDGASDAAIDAGDAAVLWTGLDATGTVAAGTEKRFVTPALPPGAYTFTMTGSGDADLYVKVSSAPTTRSYDCRPFISGSNESCAVTLSSPDVIYVMVRGVATQSSFTLQGR